MKTVVVVFAILLGILLLISALGGSLNTTERFEDVAYDVTDGDEPETFYNPATSPVVKEEHKETHAPPATPFTPPTQEPFRNVYDAQSIGDVEPYEDSEQHPSFASLSS